VRVQRTIGRAGAVSLQYTTGAGSATEGVDYTSTSGTLSWAAGDFSDKVITIPVKDDTEVEIGDMFTLTLSALTGATLDGSSTMNVAINDNDGSYPPPMDRGGGGSSDLALLALLAGILLARFAARPRRATLR